MRFNRKIAPDTKSKQNFVTKKRLREDEISFDKFSQLKYSYSITGPLTGTKQYLVRLCI